MFYNKSNNRYIPLLLLIFIDLLAGILFFWPFSAILNGEGNLKGSAFFPLAGGLLFLLTFWLMGSYRNQSLLHGESKIKQVIAVIAALLFSDFYIFVINRDVINDLSQSSSLVFGTWHLMTMVLLAVSRPAIAWLVNILKKRKIINLTTIIIAFQTPSEAVFMRIKRYIINEHHRLQGYFAATALLPPEKSTIKYLGDVSGVSFYLKDKKIDEVVILGNPSTAQATPGLLVALRMLNAEIKMVPIEFDFLSGLMKMSSLKDLPHVKLSPRAITPANQFAKLTLDVSVSLVGLTITLILFPVIALIIKSTSPGPVFYRQQRLGKHARPFTLIKFRTMHHMAEQDGPQLSSNFDKRITRGGKILRYWHLDELPQFWNILKGEMSLVGPRPERPYYARMLRDKIPYYKAIYQVKPGLTSLGMVKYGYASTLEEMTDRLYYDIAYINNPSLITDLKVIGQTLWYIFQKAYKDPKASRLEKERAAGIRHDENDDVLQRWLDLKK